MRCLRWIHVGCVNFHNRYVKFHMFEIKKKIDEEAVKAFERKKDLKFHILGNYINIVIFLEKGGISDEFT